MTRYAFPKGRYFSVIGNIRIGSGGQTRMALLRHRLIQTHAKIDIPMVTFNPVPSYDPVRENLLSEGLLLPESRIINMHEWLRDHQHEEDPSREAAAPETAFTVEETYEGGPDGTPWRISIEGAHSGQDHWDYLRPDGTRYLRTPADSMLGTTFVLDHQERIVANLDGLGDLWRWWLSHLFPPQGSVFLISDSRFVAFELGFLDDPRVHLIHQMHNPHQSGARQWNSPVSQSYRQSMESISNLDGLSVLTERQKRDIELAYGAHNNLFVIPNPVDPVTEPESPPERDHGRIVMVARLESQKRIDLAISAFEQVAKKNSLARLDIYGDGPDRESLEAQIAHAGLNDRITLHGHTPQAADQFWSADLGWLTSAFEGFCLALLEARLRGCPFVAFDVPYGPAEQIDSGTDGVLVPAGDVNALTEATLDLLADPDRLEAMREPARQGALSHGFEKHLELWAAACQKVVELKPHRSHITHVTFTPTTLRLKSSHPQLAGTIRIQGSGDRNRITVRWQTWLPDSTAPIDVPLECTVDGDLIHVQGKVTAQELPIAPNDPRAQSRLLIEWLNSTHTISLVEKKRRSLAQKLVRKTRTMLRR